MIISFFQLRMCLGKVTSNWRSAASVILACKTTRRVLMLRRGETAKFMPNTMVFPGGVIDKSDSKMGDEFRIAAVRELFEESGVLLTKNGWQTSANNSEMTKMKSDIVSDASKFRNLSETVCADKLIDWTTFITPANYPRRFLTKFYLVLIDDEPAIDLCTSEMSDYSWIDPKDCVDEAYSGKYALPPPQVYELTRLSQIKDWEYCQKYGNVQKPICPQPIKTIGENMITNCFPGDHMYIDENCFQQPLRQLSADRVTVSPTLPTHRVTYYSEPMYHRVRVYQHLLKPADIAAFHQFETHSKDLL
uniref:Nudix hydrolase domain-containing protein n=2 Tax=Caenorhabditis tropicalis TaxID=1561998 RepID=A0A1I7TJY0_9PELO